MPPLSVRLRVLPQILPIDGREIELQATASFIQWRYVADHNGEYEWQDLIAVADITGPAGPAIELRTDGSYIQYRTIGTTTWIDLILVSDLLGPPGPQGPQGPSVADGDKGDISVSSGGTAWGINDGAVKPDHLDPTLPAQFRAVIEAVSFDDLPWVLAWEHGVPGDGTDQHVALQAIIDALPATGGAIMYRGDVNLGSAPLALNLHGRRNTLLSGIPGSGNGTGSGQSSILRSTAGAIGSGVKVIDCSGTFNVSFEHSMVLASNASFNGVMLDYGSVSAVTPGDDSALMHLNELFFQGLGPTGRMLQLHGATQGMFENITFSGRGTHVSMQQIAGVGFCNVHKFINCNFKPTGSEYPVSGSGEGILFLGGNVQASSGDGIGRFWRTSLSQSFRGVSINTVTFYDVTAPGGIWAEFYWGSGLNIQSCMMGGADPALGGNWGFTLGGGGAGLSEPGLRGFSVLGNSFRYLSGAMTFGGTAAADTNAKKGVIGGNNVFGGSAPASQLVSSITETRDIVFLPNNINNVPNAIGSHFNMRGLPTSAAGLVVGDVWNNAGVLTIV